MKTSTEVLIIEGVLAFGLGYLIIMAYSTDDIGLRVFAAQYAGFYFLGVVLADMLRTTIIIDEKYLEERRNKK